MDYLNRQSMANKQYPERILQFGEGNFYVLYRLDG